MIMAGEGKCAECARRDRPCVSTSWAALDKARDDLTLEISSDEKARDALVAQLGALQARIERNKKVREQADARAAEKMACLTRELEESGELFAVESLGELELDLGWNGVSTPFTWSGAGNETVAVTGGSSSGS
jgi:chromosome segregation ATPase